MRRIDPHGFEGTVRGSFLANALSPFGPCLEFVSRSVGFPLLQLVRCSSSCYLWLLPLRAFLGRGSLLLASVFKRTIRSLSLVTAPELALSSPTPNDFGSTIQCSLK